MFFAVARKMPSQPTLRFPFALVLGAALYTHALENSGQQNDLGSIEWPCPGCMADEGGLSLLQHRSLKKSLPAEVDAPSMVGENRSLRILRQPPCKKAYKLKQFVSQAFSWCDPRSVPADRRVPKKLQGLFWMKDLPLPDVAMCLSTAEWNADKLEAKVSVWDHFQFLGDSWSNWFTIGSIYRMGMTYHITFTNSSLSEADIEPYSGGSPLQKIMGAGPMWMFRTMSEFPMVELPSASAPGDRWKRPSYGGISGTHVNTYYLWRVLDGDGVVQTEAANQMLSTLRRRPHDGDVVRWYDKINGKC